MKIGQTWKKWEKLLSKIFSLMNHIKTKEEYDVIYHDILFVDTSI